MEKNFFEAFPNLKLTGARKDLFEQVVVERITATRRKDILRIYIRSERLIEKEDVYGVEQEIKKQFFPKDNIIIKIYEKFILSGQYNPEKLMDTYKDSVLMELKDTEHMLYTMFRQADMEYPDEQTVKLILEDSVIAKSKEDELIRILDKVLNERCGFSVKFHVDYREAAESKYREEDELKIQQIVANIADRVAVLYAGQIVELGTVEEVFYDPRHPYTWALLSSLPQLAQRNTTLFSITGTPPSLYNQIVGDAFAPRNQYCMKVDTLKEPPMFKVTDTHYAKTWLLDPRAPKIEKPEAIQDIHEKLVKAFNI